MSEQQQGEEVWVYVSDREKFVRTLDKCDQRMVVPGSDSKHGHGSERRQRLVLAIRSPHRSRITAEQELWYALVRVSMELGHDNLTRLLSGWLVDIYSDDFRKAVALAVHDRTVDSTEQKE